MKDNARRFSYTDPIQYQGALYPSTVFGVEDSRGNVKDTRVFSDRQGQYFALDSQGSPIPVILQQSLPEVEIRPQRKRKADAFGEYLTMSNDRTRVNNVPHRKYNPHLEDRAVKGAQSNALWEQEHPDLSSWGYAASALPFAVAASPIAIAAGDALAGTSLGQAATRGLGIIANAAKNSTLLPWADAAVTSGFGAKGMQDVGNGTFTPETAMDLMPLVQVASKSGRITGLNHDIKTAEGLSQAFQNTKLKKGLADNLLNSGNINDGTFKFTGYIEDPLSMHFKRAKAKGYDASDVKILNLSQDTPENMTFFKRTAQKFDMTPEEVKSYLLNHMNRHGHASVPNWEKVIIHDGRGGDKLNAILSHELDHAIHTPNEPIPDGVFFPRIKNLYGNEFTKQNNTEVAARGSQLHDYFGHVGNEPITEEMLKYAKNNYVKDTGINNDMNDLLWSVNDYKGLADWMTKYATGLIPFGIVGTAYNNKE